MDLCDFKTSLVYRLSFRIVRATQRNPVLKNKLTELEKMVQGLRALTAHPEVLSSVSSNHMMA